MSQGVQTCRRRKVTRSPEPGFWPPSQNAAAVPAGPSAGPRWALQVCRLGTFWCQEAFLRDTEAPAVSWSSTHGWALPASSVPAPGKEQRHMRGAAAQPPPPQQELVSAEGPEGRAAKSSLLLCPPVCHSHTAGTAVTSVQPLQGLPSPTGKSLRLLGCLCGLWGGRRALRTKAEAWRGQNDKEKCRDTGMTSWEEAGGSFPNALTTERPCKLRFPQCGAPRSLGPAQN